MTGAWLEFEERLRDRMEKYHIAGAAVSVCDKDGVLYAKGFGLRDVAGSYPVTPATVFGTASVSKSFTALAILGLADAGKLSIEDPVRKHLPEFRFAGDSGGDDVTIKHLLSHTTGLPPVRRRQEITRFQEHIEYLATEPYAVLGEPGRYFSYANDAFLLLGAIIERITGRLFRRYMTETILDAAGMHRSTYSLEELKKLCDVSVPYAYNKKSGTWEVQNWPDLGTYEVGGGVRSNVLDMVKYIRIYLNDGKVGGRRLVSPEGLRQMRTPVIQIGTKRFYGLAVEMVPDHGGFTLVKHGGGQPGVSSHFGFVPEAGIGACVLTNVSDIPAEEIWFMAVNASLGLPPDMRPHVEVPLPSVPAGTLARMAGEYAAAEGGHVTIKAEQGILQADVNGEEFELRVSSDDTAFYEEMGQQRVIRFFFDEEGRPWAIAHRYRMLRKVK